MARTPTRRPGRARPEAGPGSAVRRGPAPTLAVPALGPEVVGQLTAFLRSHLRGRADPHGQAPKSGLVVGLSGGIDSAVAAALAVRAVPTSSVLALMLPVRASDPSVTAATKVARHLGLEPALIPLDGPLQPLAT